MSWKISRELLFLVLFVQSVSTVGSSQSNPLSKKPDMDGIVGENEYRSAKVYKGSTGKTFTFYCKVIGPDIYIALEVETQGWVAIGIEPADSLNKNADMFFGWVDSQGQVNVVDAFSPESQGPHPEDRNLGGTADIKQYGGVEKDSSLLEFGRRLCRGESQDHASEDGIDRCQDDFHLHSQT
jgi:hypothetical protein